jgi:hypothetical protein
MELNREQIIEALECLSSDSIFCDPKCPYYSDRYCQVALSRDALTLIKELTEEIKDLEAEYDRVYEQAEADIRGNMADGGTSCRWCIAGHRADTVRKFMEFAHEESWTFGDVWIVDLETLDQKAKEMLEENNV